MGLRGRRCRQNSFKAIENEIRSLASNPTTSEFLKIQIFPGDEAPSSYSLCAKQDIDSASPSV